MSRASSRLSDAVRSMSERRSPAGRRRPRGERRLGGPERDHRGEALGEGVVDLAGEPLALLVDAAVALGGGQLGLGRAQLVDRLGAALGLE